MFMTTIIVLVSICDLSVLYDDFSTHMTVTES